MAKKRNAKVLWGGGIVRCNSENNAEYLGNDNTSERTKYLSGYTSAGLTGEIVPGLLLKLKEIDSETHESALTVNTEAKNNTDADAYVYDNGKVYIFKSPCTTTMKCTYNLGAQKLFDNNTYMWFMSLEDGKFTVTCDYYSFGNTNNNNNVRMPNNNGTNYFNFQDSGTAEYYFTKLMYPDDNSFNQTPAGMFKGCTGLKKCSIPCEIRKISSRTFEGCTNLEKWIDNTNFVTDIGENAFNKCIKLSEILIPKHAKLGNSSFVYCSGATAIIWEGVSGGTSGTTVKCNMTSIPDYAFYNCYQISQTELDNGVFYDVLIIPSGITGIGNYSFSIETTAININRRYPNVYFNGVTNIDSNAFYSNRPNYGMKNIYGFETVKTIGDNAFKYNVELERLVSGKTGTICGTENVENLGGHSFEYCSKLVEFKFGTRLGRIGTFAFNECSSLSSLTGINNVKYIDDYAFRNCTSIAYLNLSSLIVMGQGAFQSCTGLTSVTIGNSVTSISDSGFEGCTSLSSVAIPNSVTSIGWSAFNNCDSLSRVTIGNGVTSIGNEAFAGCNSLASITIPNNVTSIGNDAFNYCSRLTSVAIPNSVTSIGSGAFSNCSGLTTVTIGSGITSIGENTFDSCTSLSSVAIPNSVTSIGWSAFGYCYSLSSVTIPNSVTSIDASAFQSCTGLTSVTIGNSVTSIGSGAFFDCRSLTSIDIPDSVISIDTQAFQLCRSLTSATIGNSVTIIGGSAFNNCSGLTTVTIGSGVTSIDSQAFSSCSSLTSVTIPNSVTSIGSSAFTNCIRLSSITIEATTPPTLGGNAFSNTNNCNIYVPSESVNTYKSASSWWSYYASRIRAIS